MEKNEFSNEKNERLIIVIINESFWFMCVFNISTIFTRCDARINCQLLNLVLFFPKENKLSCLCVFKIDKLKQILITIFERLP